MVQKTKVTLNFCGDDLDPRELTERLGGLPTRAATKGGTWLTPSGAERVVPTGRWNLRVDADEATALDAKIASLFASLTPDREAWRDLSGRYRGYLFVGLFLRSPNEELMVAPETSLALGERGLSLRLDIYERD